MEEQDKEDKEQDKEDREQDKEDKEWDMGEQRLLVTFAPPGVLSHPPPSYDLAASSRVEQDGSPFADSVTPLINSGPKRFNTLFP